MSCNLNQPKRVRKLAVGSQGSSVCVYHVEDGVYRAGKEINKTTYDNWEKEIAILKEVGHKSNCEHVVRYYESHVTKLSVILFTELCDGNVDQFVRGEMISPATSQEDAQKVSPKDYFKISALEICRQAAEGIYFLHSKCDIIHRDIKPNNILLLRTKQSTLVKVADFGLSRVIPKGSDTVLTESRSTWAYMAHECYDSLWTKPSDIFALGIFFHFVLSDGKHPYGEQDYEQKGNICEGKEAKLNALRNSNLPFSKEQKITCSDLVKRMVAHQPEDRLTIEDVACHPAFWSSKKKVEFYKILKDDVKPMKAEKLDNLNQYNKALLCDDQSESAQFNITLDSIPAALKNRGRNRVRTCSDVKSLLVVIRNEASHAIESPKEVKKCLGVKGDIVDWDIFLERLTGPYPQLLVHLYEFFRNSKYAREYYARSNSPVSNSSTEVGGTPSSSLAGCSPSSSNDAPQAEWEKFYYDRQFSAQMFDYSITVKYNGVEIKKEKYKIKHPVEIRHHPSPDSSDLDFQLPTTNDDPDDDIRKILENLDDGIRLRSDQKSKSLYALRACRVHTFFSSHIQEKPVKMEQQNEVEVFSYERFYEQFKRKQCSAESSTATFVLGKDPIKSAGSLWPVIVTVESSVISALNATFPVVENRSDSLLFSEEYQGR